MNVEPIKLLTVQVSTVTINASWTVNDGTGDPFVGFPYQWVVTLLVTPQPHSGFSTRVPYSYNGQDIAVGDWLSNAAGGLAWKIISITSATAMRVVAVVEDVDRFNTFSAAGQNGDGSPPALQNGFVFSLSDSGTPLLSPVVGNVMPSQWQTDIIGRFAYRNEAQSAYRVQQPGHTFVIGNLISLTNTGYVLATPLARVIGQVNSVNIPDSDYFTYAPVGKIIYNISPALPGNPGDIIYIDPTVPGAYSTTITSQAMFIKINTTTGVIIGGSAASSGVNSISSGTGLSGGMITGSGTIALANTTVTPGTYSLSTIVVDAQGRLTAASSAVALAGTGTVLSITAGAGLTGGTIVTTGTFSLSTTSVTPGTYSFATVVVDVYGRIQVASSGTTPGTVSTVVAGTGLTGGTITNAGTISLANSAVTPGTYTISTITVDQQGRLTAAHSGTINSVASFASVPVSLNARAAYVVNVREFGPAGYGVTDSAPAINAAFAYVRAQYIAGGAGPFQIVFPNDVYTVLSPINATSIRTENIDIDGNGSTILAAFNGGIVFDFYDSRFFRVHNLNIRTSGSYVPSIGIAGGYVGTEVADCHVFENIWVNGTFSLTCAYFCSTETSRLSSMHLWNASANTNSFCLILDGQNHWGVSSTFVTQTQGVDVPNSFNEMLFEVLDLRHSGAGHGIWIGCVSRHTFLTSYVACLSATAAIVLWGCTASGQGALCELVFDMHQETNAATTVFLLSGANAYAQLHGFTYRDQGPEATNYIFQLDSTASQTGSVAITSGHIWNADIQIVGTSSGCRMFDNPANWTVHGDVYTESSTLFNRPNTFYGRTIVNYAVAYSAQNLVNSVATGTGLTGGPITQTGTISLANTSVTPGTYTFSTIAVDAQGRITSATSGVGGVGMVSLTGDVTGSGTGTFATTLAASGVTAGTYSRVVVNSKGLVTGTSSIGLGAMTPTPTASTNGTALGVFPANAVGARLYLPSGSSVTFTIASIAPSSPPTSVFTASYTGTGAYWDEWLASSEMIYITASTGSPLFRWF